MKLRARILVAAALLLLFPLLLLALGGRQETVRRLRHLNTERATALAEVLSRSLALRGEGIRDGLAALAADLREDHELRRALSEPDASDRRERIDYAEGRMALMGFQFLQIQDREGRILSSGHFREAFDGSDPGLIAVLARQEGGGTLVRARRPEGSFLALARLDSLDLDGRRYWLAGGLAVDRAFLDDLAGAGQLDLSLVTPSDTLVAGSSRGVGVAGPRLPYLNAEGRMEWAELRLVDSEASLRALLRGFDYWLLGTLAVTIAGGLLLAFWVSARLSRPLRELAARTECLDLEDPGSEFTAGLPADREDEVGVLTRTLGRLAGRLRHSARLLREAERRATLGDLARQVTHDIRNGFTPLRNVVGHLSQVAREDEAARLKEVFLERENTLSAGLEFLEDLAGHYARLSPRRRQERVDLNAVLAPLVPVGGTESACRYLLSLAPGLPALEADPGSLRRIAENLLRNARESLGERGGCIRVTTSLEREEQGGQALVLSVADDGPGIPPEQIDRIFDDFFTSKSEGGGLGLSIVRRLSADLGGRVSVESAPGRGAVFRVRFPVTPGADAPKPAEEPA